MTRSAEKLLIALKLIVLIWIWIWLSANDLSLQSCLILRLSLLLSIYYTI